MPFSLQIGRLRIGASLTPAYEGATQGRRGKAWQPPAGSATSAVIAGGESTRRRARHLVRNNPWARNIVRVWASSCIGTGIKPILHLEDDGLKETIKGVWSDWIREADADGVLDYYGMQTLIMRSMVESGELFVRYRRRRPEDGLTVPLQLQLIEADQVPLHLNRREGQNKIIAGIEFDPMGRRVAYWMHRTHPGDPMAGFGDARLVRVPAENVAHIFLPERPGQVRGVSWLSSILVKLHDLDQYDDAEVVRKKIAAMFSVFIIQPDTEDSTPMLASDQEIIEEGLDSATAEARLEPGTAQALAPGEDVRFSEPADVGGSYQAFNEQQLHAVAAGGAAPFHMVTGDLSKVNFASTRAGLIDFRRTCLQIQANQINHQLNTRTWMEFTADATLAGRFGSIGRATLADIRRRVEWKGQAFESVQPIQDETAREMRLRNGFSSRTQIAAELGADAEDIEKQIAAENARADALGLVFDSDPRRTNRAGSGQAVLAAELAATEEDAKRTG